MVFGTFQKAHEGSNISFFLFFQFGEIVVKCGHAQCCSFFIGLILCVSDHISSIFLFFCLRSFPTAFFTICFTSYCILGILFLIPPRMKERKSIILKKLHESHINCDFSALCSNFWGSGKTSEEFQHQSYEMTNSTVEAIIKRKSADLQGFFP